MDGPFTSESILNTVPAIWTFILLTVRFIAISLFLPGIGAGERGIMIRMPMVVAFSISAAFVQTPVAPPDDFVLMFLAIASEFAYGFAVSMLVVLIVAAAQTAGQLASTTMGLGAGQLFDPTLGMPTADLSRLYGDLTVVIFFLIGGHHFVMQSMFGLNGTLIPGRFIVGADTIDIFIRQSGELLRMGAVLSAPVVVALLLTQFVMGLLSKAVPTINIFIISFPLTICIGLLISVLALPEVMNVIEAKIAQLDSEILTVSEPFISNSRSPSAKTP